MATPERSAAPKQQQQTDAKCSADANDNQKCKTQQTQTQAKAQAQPAAQTRRIADTISQRSHTPPHGTDELH